MNDFKHLVLCDDRNSNIEVHVWADLIDGKLTISGQELGNSVEEFWGDKDFEYWYSFTESETEKLISALHGENDPEAVLIKEFGGRNGCRNLREFCEKKGIEYSFFSYV